ncbi:MAG: DUF1080 domain-containing protein [Woeseiaceae bacterium]|nr:DUF1080 domain-containing protein [Woeseiaceae bacterium]
MNLKTLIGLLVLMLPGLADVAYAEEPNTLSDKEKNAGWRLLFDGRTTAGWRGYRSKTMPASWKVENGSLLSRPQKGESWIFHRRKCRTPPPLQFPFNYREFSVGFHRILR